MVSSGASSRRRCSAAAVAIRRSLGNVNRSSSEVTQWGLGINQFVDAAAMELYATYKNYSLDANGFGTAAGSNTSLLNKGTGGTSDISVFVIGTRINF